MPACPNITSPEWRELVNKIGEFEAMREFILNGERIPDAANYEKRATSAGVYIVSSKSVPETSEKNKELLEKLTETSQNVVNKPIGNGDNDYFIGDKKIHTRVTRKIKALMSSKFRKPLSEENKQFAPWGLKGHRDMQNIFSRYLTPQGTVVKDIENKLVPQSSEAIISELDPAQRGLFSVLHEYVKDLLSSYPENTIFRIEQTIYSDNGGQPGERDIAGTMDFVAIKPNGKVDVLDWKFTRVYPNQESDIQWYKQNEWNAQMLEYKKILKRDYNLKDEDFEKTRMIPFAVLYKGSRKQGEMSTTYIPEDIEVADLELTIDEKPYLLPVVTPDESTGNQQLDSLIRKLTALYNTLQKVPAPDRQRNIKNEQLNNLFKAIRHLQVAKNFAPLAEQIGILIKDTQRVIEEHKQKFEVIADHSEKEISDQAATLLLRAQALHIYQNLDTEFKDFYGDSPTPEEQEVIAKVNEVTGKARSAFKDINDIVREFGEKYIASRRGVDDLLKAEKVVTGITRAFGTSSELPPAAIQTLFRMVDNANNAIQFDLNEAKDELVSIKSDIDKIGGLKAALPLLKSKDENKLIDEYDGEFYEQLREAQSSEDIDWIKDNIDMIAFTEELKKRYKEGKRTIEETRYSYDDSKNTEAKEAALKRLALTTDPTKIEAYIEKDQYYVLKRFPQEKWRSKEYQELQKNPPLFRFYEFIRKWNHKARELGYLEGKNAERNFLPYLYKSFSEKINLGGEFSFVDWLTSSISIDANIAGYGNYNTLTQQIEDSIPIYFTSPIEEKERVSEDLFLNMAAYVRAIINYDHKSQIDGQVKALYFIEQNKESLRVNTVGNLIRINGIAETQPSNDRNSDLLLNHIKSLQYGQKYTSVEATDALLGDWAKGYNKFADKVNKKLGSDIIPKAKEGSQVSLTRLMDTFNRFFTIKNMGLNVATSASVLAGGNFQGIINTGKYYTKSEFLASEFQHASHYVMAGNQNLHMALIKSFMPIDENLNREINKLGVGKLTGNSFSDFMMFMMRGADHIVQYANFLAFMKNTIVIDGKLFNARDYYRNSRDYSNRYNLPQDQIAAMEREFDSKVAALIEKYGIEKLSKVDEKGKLSIEGIPDMKDESVFKYRSLITAIGKRATGNVSPENEMLIRMNAIFRSMLVFKNWIPGLVKQRVGGMRYDSATETYEYGRLRMLLKHLGPLALLRIRDIKNIIKANDKGVELMKKFYKAQKESYTNKTDKELELTEAEFADMFRQALGSQLKELFIVISMIAIVAAVLPLFKPEDDEEQEVKNKFKFASRILDKVKDEVWFYYNPVGLQQILNGSIFPAMGLFTDAAKVVTATMTEVYGVSIGDEELVEKNYVIKNWMRALPLTKEIPYYIAMFDAELAKELGIQISSQSRLK